MKTTAKHFKYFVSRCRYYQKELGLMGYNLDCQHKHIPELGHCGTDIDAKSCIISLCTNWGDGKLLPLTFYELDMLAYHEVMHLRLADLTSVAQDRYATRSEILRYTEEAVTALENFYRDNGSKQPNGK